MVVGLFQPGKSTNLAMDIFVYRIFMYFGTGHERVPCTDLKDLIPS